MSKTKTAVLVGVTPSRVPAATHITAWAVTPSISRSPRLGCCFLEHRDALACLPSPHFDFHFDPGGKTPSVMSQGLASFGFENAEQAADAAVGLGFGVFVRRQRALPRLGRERVHERLAHATHGRFCRK